METTNSFETLATIYQWTLCNIPDGTAVRTPKLAEEMRSISLVYVGIRCNCGSQHSFKFAVNHRTKRWSPTWSARKWTWYKTAAQNEECWPYVNECDFTRAIKLRSTMTDGRLTGWTTCQVSTCWLEEQMATSPVWQKSMYALSNSHFTYFSAYAWDTTKDCKKPHHNTVPARNYDTFALLCLVRVFVNLNLNRKMNKQRTFSCLFY
jgi:hypothetical protein